MRIRPATQQDLSAVAALERMLFGADAWSPEQVLDELTSATRCSVVAVDGPVDGPVDGAVDGAADGAVVLGYAVLWQGVDTADLQRVGVHPGYRRRGVARALLAGLALDARPRVLLEVRADNAAAIALYERHGFVALDRRRSYYRDGTDALVLQRTTPTTPAPPPPREKPKLPGEKPKLPGEPPKLLW